MKATVSFLILFFSFLVTYAQGTLYSASKAGLNLREKPDINAPVLTKIPYGEKMDLIRTEKQTNTETEGMKFSWAYVSYLGQKGYVADIYTLSFAPPKHKDVESYLNSLATQVGKWEEKPEFETADGAIHDNAVQTLKILYNNGVLYRMNQGYEWENVSVWLPGFSMEQAFVLARLLPQFNNVLHTSDSFPKKSQKISDEKSVTVSHSESWPFCQTIRYELTNVSFHTVEIRNEDGEISITYSSGI